MMRADPAQACGKARDERRGTDAALRFSLLFFLLFPFTPGPLRGAALVLAAAGLLSTRVLRSPFVWGVLALLSSWRVVELWPLADNHAYLLIYWCLAVTLSRLASEPAAVLASSGRWLVALVFVCAVAWKLVLSDDYLDGTFFRVLLLADVRFEGLARSIGALVTGPGGDAVAESRRFFDEGSGLGSDAALVEPTALRSLAAGLTWGAALLEAALALAFLAPLPAPARPLRHALLLVFCIGTYALAPVPGFGWLLLTMGWAGLPTGSRRLRLAYLAALCLLVVENALLRA